MMIGKTIKVFACKADGSVYRKWSAFVESVEPNLIVTAAPAGSLILSKGRLSAAQYHMRGYYWLDKLYNLFEIYTPDGRLAEIYLNIASLPEVTEDLITFKDHELDVSKIPPNAARIVDEDEFLEAAALYQYSREFQEQMYAAAREALEVAENWAAKPSPVFKE